MHVIALVPVLTLFCLAALGIFLVSRKATLAGRAKAEIEGQVATILKKDRENDQALVENILAGVSIDECLGRYRDGRVSLLPGSQSSSGAAWTHDDLEHWQRERTDQQLAAVSRGSLVPGLLAAIGLITLGTVLTVVLYGFHTNGNGRTASSSNRRMPFDFDIDESEATAFPNADRQPSRTSDVVSDLAPSSPESLTPNDKCSVDIP